MRRDYVYIALLLLTLGAGAFGSLHFRKENRQHKHHIKELEKINQRNFERIDSLKVSVKESDKKDSILVEQTKSLYITKTNAKAADIISMPADSFLILLSAYIDSAARNVHH